jgi:hypothetical protein
MPERKPRHQAPTTRAADPTEQANEPAHPAAGMTPVASKGATASQQAYGSDMQQTRLQMNSDRKTNVEETMSNMEKKGSDTDEGIVKNMK